MFHGISRRQARALLALLLSESANGGTRLPNHGIITDAATHPIVGDNLEAVSGRIGDEEAVSSTNLQGIEKGRMRPEEGEGEEEEEGRAYPGSYLMSGGPGPGPGPGGGHMPVVAVSALLRRRASLARFLKSRCR